MEQVLSRFAGSVLTAFATSSNGDDFCKQLVHKVMSKYAAVGAVIGSVGNDSELKPIGSYGKWSFSCDDAFQIWAETPLAAAVRDGKTVKVNRHAEMRKLFPNGNIELRGSRSFIFQPFTYNPNAVGFMALGFANEDIPASINEGELSLASLASEYFTLTVRRSLQTSHKDRVGSSHLSTEPTELNNRQLRILQLMSEGMTNYQIGRNLNLSESSIKQESVKIYRSLGVNTREAAVEVGQSSKLI